jgi:hypothetical protein
MSTNTIATEAGHWYAADGTPTYTVPNASKPGEMRPTTLRDARKLGLVPSVTTILRVANQPGLNRWKEQTLLHAALTLPRIDGESEDDFARRAMEDAAAQSLAARNKGTDIHGAIERRFRMLPTAPEFLPYIEAAQAALDSAAIISPTSGRMEHSFASPLGYGGKVDLHGDDFVLDFKTKADWTDADVKRGLAYDEHGMQLVAYAHGLNIAVPRLFNVFIATESPGKWHVHEWPAGGHGRLWSMFTALLEYWKAANL